MLLINLPVALWQTILTTWLNDIRQVVRVSWVCSESAVTNPLRDAYTGNTFHLPLPDCPEPISSFALRGLCEWIQSRKVYLNQLASISNSHGPLLSLWNDLLIWTGPRLTSLIIVDRGKSDLAPFLYLCHHNARQLKHLRIKSFSPNPDHFGKLLHNNCSSLISLIFDSTKIGPKYTLPSTILCPSLEVLHCRSWESSFIVRFLSGCPNLTALSVSGMRNAAGPIVPALSGSCPRLQRLRLTKLLDLSASDLLQISRGCPQLQYLELLQLKSMDTRDDEFADAVTALPCLHTLLVDMLDEEPLVTIATRGYPSLRVVDWYLVHTFHGLRQITAGLPGLTKLGLSIWHIDFIAGPNQLSLLEHCGRLEVLKFMALAELTDLANIVFESVVQHCHNLHTLIINNGTVYNGRKLNALVDSCPHLSTVRVQNTRGVTVPPNRPGFVLTNEAIKFAEWMPELFMK